MINVNELTTQLRMLPDQALQRVAMMYKQDPYIFPMIISEGMARKKLRQAAQARTAQPQPKVADQAVASLGYTPEEVGIGALQASNMQGMADGGIAGYDEGALVSHSEPVVRMSGGGVARYAGQNDSLVRLPNPAAQFYSTQLGPSTDALTELHRQAYTFEAERLAAEKDLAKAEAELQRFGVRQRQLDPEGFARAKAARDEAAQRRDTAAKRYSQESARLVPKDEAERAFKNPSVLTAGEAKIYSGLYPQEAPKGPMMPVPDVQIAGQTPPAQGKPAVPAAGIGTLPATTAPARAEQMIGETERAGLRRLNQMKMDVERRGDEERIQYEAGKPKGEAFADLAERLKKQEAAEPGEREQAKAMAIFNAGLAMMAGGSPNALQNIAKGAMAGVAEYSGAMKELKQAAKERMKIQADIEQARRAEARGDNETALKLMQRQNDRMDKVEDHMIDFGTKMGLSKADVASRMDALRLELGSRERIAAAQLAQEPGDIRSLRAMAADPKLLETAASVQGAKGEGTLVRQLALEAMKNPAALTMMKQQNPRLYEAVMAELNKLGGGAEQSGDRALVEKYLNKP